ncbi:MAG: MOSC domain-containing protein [Bacteroidetes bacterium]|nr:MAG: MOSC domain-containing protein [Bacteroidota bacterium]
MELHPALSKIIIYPIKSLDGIELDKASVSEGGCLLRDREYAMFNEERKFINGKSNPLVHTLRSQFDLVKETVSFKSNTDKGWRCFHLKDDINEIQEYLSDHFAERIVLLQNKTGRFLDIPDLGGVTILSTASLKEVSTWYPDLDLEESRKRFRATLEIEAVPAFWEDNLFSVPDNRIEFKIGDVKLFGESPRERCVVPTRNTQTAEITHAFPKTFATNRASTLPESSKLESHGHYYFLSVDCSIPPSETGKEIAIGDEVSIV